MIDNLHQSGAEIPRIHIKDVVSLPTGFLGLQAMCSGIEQAVLSIGGVEHLIIRDMWRPIHVNQFAPKTNRPEDV